MYHKPQTGNAYARDPAIMPRAPLVRSTTLNASSKDPGPSRLQLLSRSSSVYDINELPGAPTTMVVWSHDSHTLSSEVLIDLPLLPGANEGDVAELRYKNSKGKMRNLFFIVHAKAQNSNAQISVPLDILNALEIPPRAEVQVRKHNSHRVSEIDQLELHFRGAYLSRADLYRISKYLQGKCVYSGQRILRLGGLIRLNVESLYKDGNLRFSGYVSSDTRVVYRSDSAHLTILIQISSEMWEFDETGEVAFQKLINTFMPVTLKKFNAKGDQHLVTLIFFTNICSKTNKPLAAGEVDPTAESYYKVVVDQLPVCKWAEITKELRKEFSRFPKDVLLRQKGALQGTVLPSAKGNLLEAINLVVTQTGQKFLDRDFRRTNLQTIIITPSSGVFDVTARELYEVSRSVMNVELGVEVVCLARPPLHVAPLFRCKGPDGHIHNFVPTWMNVSYWSTPQRYVNQWLPRATIYDLQMMGILENELRAIPIHRLGQGYLSSKFMKSYDLNLFKSLQALNEEKANNERAKALILKPKLMASIPSSTIGPLESPTLASFTNAASASVSEVTQLNATSTLKSLDKPGTAKSSLGLLLRNYAKTDSNNTITMASDAFRSLARRLSVSSLKSSEQHPTTMQTSIESPKSSSPRQVKPQGSLDTRQKGPPISQASQPSAIVRPQSRYDMPVSSVGSTRTLDSKASMSLRVPIVRSNTNPLAPMRPGRRLSGTFASKSPGKEGHSELMDLAIVNAVKPLFETQHDDYWRVIENPSVVEYPSAGQAYNKWAFVYPPRKKRKNVCWNSIESPAALPLCCGEFPSIHEWKNEHKLQFYDLYLGSDPTVLDKTRRLLDEMVSLRLQMGFQIVVGKKVELVEEKFFGSPQQIVTQMTGNVVGLRMYLQRPGLIHRLEAEQEGFIKVQIYTKLDNDRKLLIDNSDKTRKLRISTARSSEYELLDGRLFNPLLQYDMNWNQLDLQLADIEEAIQDTHQTPYLISSRFVLVPIQSNIKLDGTPVGLDNLSREELTVEGIQKIIANLHRNRVDVNSADTAPPRVHFYTGDLCQCVQNIYETAQKFETLGKALQRDRLTKSIQLDDLKVEMLGKYGPRIEDQRWHWKSYPQVVTGSDFVRWLIDTFSDINSVDDALAYGRTLMDAGFIRHVEDRHPLLNGHYFYRMAASQAKSDWSSGNKPSRSKTPYEHSYRPEMSTDAPEKNVKKTPLLVTCRIDVDVDPKNLSGRKEIVSVHLDRIYNPVNAFSLKFQWLNTTQRLIDEYVCTLARTGLQYGIRLVQVPTSGFNRSGRQHCFQSLLNVKLSVDPVEYVNNLAEEDIKPRPYSEKLQANLGSIYTVPPPTYQPDDISVYYHDYFLKSLGYVRDVTETYTELEDFVLQYSWTKPAVRGRHYVHHTGLVLLEIMTDNSFTAVANTVNLSRSGLNTFDASVQSANETQLLDQLQDCSANEAFLCDLFVTAKAALTDLSRQISGSSNRSVRSLEVT